MNIKTSLIVDLTDSAIDSLRNHIVENPFEYRVVLLIHPISFQYFSIKKFGNLLLSLRDTAIKLEVILSNIPEGIEVNSQIDPLFIKKFLDLLDGISVIGKVFYQKRDIYFLDDYLIFAQYLGIQEMQFVLRDKVFKSLTKKEYFHLEQFIFKQIKENKKRKKQFFYRQQLQYLITCEIPKNALDIKNNTFIDGDGHISFLKIDNYNIIWHNEIGTILSRGLKKLKSYIKINRDYRFVKEMSFNTPLNPNPKDWKKVLITGWYGTETNGDKAIIGELVYLLRSCNPNIKFLVTTIVPEITKQTNTEIEELINSKWITIEDASNAEIISECDAVIMGGGPLMETLYMRNVCSIFQIANQLRKNRIVFGCGVGPIHTDSIGVLIAEVLKLSSAGFLRDQASFDLMQKLVPNKKLSVACDPAFGYVRRWVLKNKNYNLNSNSMALLVRANTSEFASDMNNKELALSNNKSVKYICSLFSYFAEKNKFTVDLLQMNAPYVGGDDRMFNRLVGYSLPKSISVNFHREYLTLEDQLSYLNNASISLAMRYHGHVFSTAMGIPFVSIDYTGEKGKVSSLVNRINYSQNSIIWDDLNSQKGNAILENISENRETVSKELLNEADQLVDLLKLTYEKEFNINLKTIKY